MLFDKICRKNGITHRLTQPASPTTTGKVEWFHLTLRRELLDAAEPFGSVGAAVGGTRVKTARSQLTVNACASPRRIRIDTATLMGLLRARPRKRARESYRRFERPGPMQLWGIDIVGGVQLVDTAPERSARPSS